MRKFTKLCQYIRYIFVTLWSECNVIIIMWLYIRQLIQLLLSPAKGWEDISEAAKTADEIQRRGFYPWIGITAASEFLRLIYNHKVSFVDVLQGAIAIGGALFISLYIARIFLDMILPQHVDRKVNLVKVNVFAIYLVGMVGLYHIISNAMPASMTFLNFLPVFSLLIVFKSTTFLGISEDKTMTFLWLSAVGVIVIPIAVAALLSFII